MKWLVVLIVVCALLSVCWFNQGHQPQEVHIDIQKESDFGQGYNDIDKYMEFCRAPNVVLPDDFFTYQQIKELGNFCEFFFQGFSEKSKGDVVKTYAYTIEDENNRIFTISTLTDGAYAMTEGTADINPKDMRKSTVVKEGGGEYPYGNLRYCYDRLGRLEHVIWEMDGAYFRLTSEDNFAAFEPNPAGSFVEQLLYLESAPAARDAFADMIATPLDSQN